MDDRGHIFHNPSDEEILSKKLMPLSELEVRLIASLSEEERRQLYKEVMSATTDTQSIPLDLTNTFRSAKTEIEKAMDRMAALMPGYFGGNDREGISKEERRKRTKMKKAAKKQRRK